MQAADQPLPKLLGTHICKAISQARGGTRLCGAAGTSGTQPALGAGFATEAPVVQSQGQKRRRELQADACTSRGRCSCKSSALAVPGAELQPRAALDRSSSLPQAKLFCLRTICSASRRVGSGEGAQMDGFFDNSLKRSTQAQRLHMPKGRPARRAVA